MKQQTTENADLKEKARHGSVFFPFQKYTAGFSPLNPVLSLHWHPEMEFTRIMEGRAVYSVDFQEYEVSSGDYICVQPNLLHTARIFPHGTMLSETFVFHLSLLGASPADICSLQYFNPIMDGTLRFPHVIYKEDPIYPHLESIFSELSSCCTEKLPGYELGIKALLFHLIRLLITHEQTQKNETSDPHTERLKVIFDYIHTHFSEDITVEDAARLCCITPSHFMHYFKEKSGTTFSQYLNQYRLNQSALLIRQGSSIADAAYSCGFNNLPYFYRRFREYYQMTPREFRSKEESYIRFNS